MCPDVRAVKVPGPTPGGGASGSGLKVSGPVGTG